MSAAGDGGSSDGGRLAAAVTVEAVAASADAGRWRQQVEVGKESDAR